MLQPLWSMTIRAKAKEKVAGARRATVQLVCTSSRQVAEARVLLLTQIMHK